MPLRVRRARLCCQKVLRTRVRRARLFCHRDLRTRVRRPAADCLCAGDHVNVAPDEFARTACVRLAIETADGSVCVLSMALFRQTTGADGAPQYLPNVSLERIPSIGPVVTRLVDRVYAPPVRTSSAPSLCWL